MALATFAKNCIGRLWFSSNNLCFFVQLVPYLIVQIKIVKLSIGPEMLSVSVQCEVDVATIAFNHHWVPVIVIQEAAGSYGGMAQDGTILVTTFYKHTHTTTLLKGCYTHALQFMDFAIFPFFPACWQFMFFSVVSTYLFSYLEAWMQNVCL